MRNSLPVPLPLPDAGPSTRGVLSALAQSISGLKNFLGGALWRGHQIGARALSSAEIYVDAINGDDARDGLTPETAVQSLDAAHKLVPCSTLGPDADVVINLAGVGGFFDDATGQAVYETQNVILPSGGNAEHQRFHYRGPGMVLVIDLASGPNTASVSSTTSLWWQQGTHARTRTASANPGAGYTLAGTRISKAAGAAWTVNDPRMRFLRVKRGGRKVIFECPIARNGAHHIDLDIHQLPDGTKLADVIQAGDSLELVKCGARLTNPHGLSISIEGHGACSGPYDHNTDLETRGGGGSWMERIERDRRFMAWGCWGLSQDRCDVTTDGDDNFYGGSGVNVNCLYTALGLLLHGNWVQIHDTANCRPDVSANDETADPIHQNVDAFSCWAVLRNRCKLYIGSDTSTSGAHLTLERNLSVYDVEAEAAIYIAWDSRFKMLDQRSRSVQVQGTNNVIGMDVRNGSQAHVTINKIHVLGDGFGTGSSVDDCRLGAGATHSWDEFHTGTGLALPSQANNWIYETFNFSRLTAYDA